MTNMNDEVQNGTHIFIPEKYEAPKQPAVLQQLEWFQDQKLGFMMHWGMYNHLGIVESWGLVDNCGHWSRTSIDWIDDVMETGGEEFKEMYWGLQKCFNPVRFRPDHWAELISDCGFKYCVVTTKHHDGFCIYDSKYTDFKVTSPDCPFSTHKYANILKVLFDAFREKGLGIGAYFSKPDWSHPDFWENRGMGFYTDSHPTYKAIENPERWAKFKEFTRNQLVEIVRDLGKVDIVWLDGGWVRAERNLNIDIDDILEELRIYNPGLISVNRNNGGNSENYLTPEQKVPENPIGVPWESCISIGSGFYYRYDDQKYKSVRTLIHTLLDIVAKGGNLLLNISPTPAGFLPDPAVTRIRALGSWLKQNGEGIYGTRIAAPYKKNGFAFTKKENTVYAFKMLTEGTVCGTEECIPTVLPAFKAVRHLATGTVLNAVPTDDGIRITIPESLPRDSYAEGFAIDLA